MEIAPLNHIDFYKSGHPFQYPKDTELIFSNLTARGSRIPEIDRVVFWGLQYFIKEYLMDQWQRNFFDKDVESVVYEYRRRMDKALGVGKVPTQHIRDLHALGYLPLEIRAVPEGSRVNLRVPMMVIYNTDPNFEWVTNYFESILSTTVWPMCTSATISNEFRGIMEEYAEKTGGDKAFVDYQGHDFSMRGMFGFEAGCMSGASHLLTFKGTDTVGTIDFIEKYYTVMPSDEQVGGSVPATEHSVMCLGGNENDEEYETIKRLITEVYPTGKISIVCDTWDFFKVLTETLPRLKDIIMARDGKVIIRPDSGDPADIICGAVQVRDYSNKAISSLEELQSWADDDMSDEVREDTPHGEHGPETEFQFYKWDGKIYKITITMEWNRYDKQYYFMEESRVTGCEVVTLTPEQQGSVALLWDIFGGTITEKGFKQLDEHIGLIYGDSITMERCRNICSRLFDKGFASTNVVFGIGSFTYTYTTRDVFGFAIKCTYAEIAGKPVEVFKKPKTDAGLKNSAKGLTAVYYDDVKKFWLVDQTDWDAVKNCAFELVYKDGVLIRNEDIEEIRANLRR